MTNRFKFRVWDKAKNKFINPFVFERDDYYKTTGMVLLDLNGKIRIADYSCGNGDNSASSVYSEIDNPDNYVIQEYTGLTDSKGNEICEGDILQFSALDKAEEPAEVIYEYGMFGCNIIDVDKNTDFWQIYYITAKLNPVIIGNVFELPCSKPGSFDNNGECLICDGWATDCPFIKTRKLEIKNKDDIS